MNPWEGSGSIDRRPDDLCCFEQNVRRTMRISEKIIERNTLYLSVGVVILIWLLKIVNNVLDINSIRSAFDSMPRVFLQASVAGAITILLVSVLLYLSGEKHKDIGFNEQNILKPLRIGFLFGVPIFLMETFAVSLLVDLVLPETSVGCVEMK